MPHSVKSKFDSIEPRILTADSAMMANHLADDAISMGEIAAAFRPVHLKDIQSFKDRLKNERQRWLIVNGDDPLNTEAFQCLKIIEHMQEEPEKGLADIKALQANLGTSVELVRKLAVSEADVDVFLRYHKKSDKPNSRF